MLHRGVNVKKVYAAQKQSEYVIVAKDHSAYEELTKEYEDSLTGEDGDYGNILESVNMITLELTEEEAKELSGESDVVVVEENIDISLNSLSESETSKNNSKTDKNKTSDGKTTINKTDSSESVANKTSDGKTSINKTDSSESVANKTNDGKTAINKTDNSETNENKTNKSTTGDGNRSENAGSSDKSGEKVNSDDIEHWNLKMINVEDADYSGKTSDISGERNTTGNSGSSNSGESAGDDEETISASSDTIKVAIIDSGVDYIDQIEVTERINLIPDEEGMSPLCDDTSGHGTAVAGVIAGTSSNENDTEGINSNVELYSIKVFDEEGEAPLSRIIEAIYICIDRGVDIINMSFGTTEYSETLETAVNDAYEAGILIIAAAGNTGEEDGTVEYPAAFDNVMSVGSVDSEANVSDFSSTDGDVDVYAPGEVITSTYFLDGTITSSGTSMAVPHVVGIASLLWQEDTSKSADFIKTLIEASANNLGDEETYSYGIVDYEYAEEIYGDFEDTYDEIITENVHSLDNLEDYSAESSKNGITLSRNEYLGYEFDSFIEFIEEELTDLYDNTSDIEIFDEIGTATASWSKDNHEATVTAAKGVTDYAGDSYDSTTLALLKLGIRNNDINSETKPKSKDKSVHRWWHSLADQVNNHLTNYIANALFMNELINCGGDTDSMTRPSGMAASVFSKMKKEIKNATDSDDDDAENLVVEVITDNGYKATTKNILIFYWGMCLHILTDMYAHRSFYYDDDAGKWKQISGDYKDDTTYLPERYKSAKQVVKNIMKNRIYIAKPKKSDTIKYSDLALTAGYTAYYTGKFKLQNFKEYLVDSGLATFNTTASQNYISTISVTKNYETTSVINAAYK